MHKHIKDTIALCSTCYRHVPGQIFEKDGKVYIERACPEHGTEISLFENDAEFYHGLVNSYEFDNKAVAFDVTNRCNLACPNCYQVPDDSPDKPESDVIKEVSEIDHSIPFGLLLAGAEVTMRKNLPELMTNVSKHFGGLKTIMLTNGVSLSKMHFLEKLLGTGAMSNKVIIGLNHWTYQGEKVHKHQLSGIDNLNIHGIIPTVSYTVDTYDHLEDVIEQSLALWDAGKIELSRIRPGADIGRSSQHFKVTLSTTINLVKKICDSKGYHFQLMPGDNKAYHQNAVINDLPVKLEHWPNVTEIELHSCTSGPYAKFVDGPASNYYHQIVIRDAYVNMGKPRLDDIPKEFVREFIHGKELPKPKYIPIKSF